MSQRHKSGLRGRAKCCDTRVWLTLPPSLSQEAVGRTEFASSLGSSKLVMALAAATGSLQAAWPKSSVLVTVEEDFPRTVEWARSAADWCARLGGTARTRCLCVRGAPGRAWCAVAQGRRRHSCAGVFGCGPCAVGEGVVHRLQRP